MSRAVIDSEAGNKVASGTSNTWSHTVATGKANRLLVVAVDAGLSLTSVTYGGKALSSLGQIVYNSGETLSFWFLLAPATGTNSVTVTASGTTYIIGSSVSLYNVAQNNPFGTLASNSGSGTASSNTVATTNANQVVLDFVNNTAASTNSPTAGQTLLIQPTGSGMAAGDIGATGTNMTLTWSFTSSVWAELSVPVNPALSLVQSHATVASGTVTSLAGTLPSGVTAGNLLVAAVTSGGQGTAITPPSGWSQAAFNQPNSPANCETGIWFIVVTAAMAGQTSWTFTQAAAHNFYIELEEWFSSSGWPTNPLDQSAIGDTASSPTTSTTIQSGTTGTTAQAGEVWIASLTYDLGAQTESGLTAGWNRDLEISDSTPNHTAAMLSNVGSTSVGAAACQFTIATAEYWAGAIATFKAATIAAKLLLIADGYGGVFL